MATTDGQFVLVTTAGFLLDQIQAARTFLGFTDALILLAITQANVEPVMRDPVLQRAYAAYDAPPPDALRRPVSINAVAQSLGLPFETVRRRVARLALIGAVRQEPAGVWTAHAQLIGPLHRRAAEGGYTRIQALYSRLADVRALSNITGSAPPPGPPPLRAAARISSDYLLRLVRQLTAMMDDAVNVMVWLEILRSSTTDGLQGLAGPAPVARRAVTRSLIARRLGLPAETVRRRIAYLVSLGACEQDGSKLIVPATVFERPEYLAMVERNLVDLRRMFESLARFGALPQAAPEGDLAADGSSAAG